LVYACVDPLDIEDNVNIIPIDKDTLNTNGIKPLVSGNSCRYRVKEFDTTGVLLKSYVYADSVVKDTVIEKTNWFATSDYIGYWQTNANDGLRFRQYRTGQPLLEWLEAKYPGTVGFSWQANSSQKTIASVDTTINVTAGTFSCYYYTGIAYKSATGWEYTDMFYSAKIGLIKSETYKVKTGNVRWLVESVELITFNKQ
jgi:hypothetical protein